MVINHLLTGMILQGPSLKHQKAPEVLDGWNAIPSFWASFLPIIFRSFCLFLVSGEVYLIKQDVGSIEYLGRSCSSANLTLKRETDSTGFFLSYPLDPKKPRKVMKVSKSLEIWGEIIPKDESENVGLSWIQPIIFQGRSLLNFGSC